MPLRAFYSYAYYVYYQSVNIFAIKTTIFNCVRFKRVFYPLLSSQTISKKKRAVYTHKIIFHITRFNNIIVCFHGVIIDIIAWKFRMCYCMICINFEQTWAAGSFSIFQLPDLPKKNNALKTNRFTGRVKKLYRIIFNISKSLNLIALKKKQQ